MRRLIVLAVAASLTLITGASPAVAGQPTITDIAVGDGTFDRNGRDTDILAAAV